jgi:L,D-transpeptidase catalytic domain.
MKSAVDLIKKQAPLRVDQALLAKISPDDVHIIVSLGKQRAYLMVGAGIVIDSPISSGKRGHESPGGRFHLLEKDPNHFRRSMATSSTAQGESCGLELACTSMPLQAGHISKAQP